MKNEDPQKTVKLGSSRVVTIIVDWLVVLLPVSLVILAGLTKFQSAVKSSIASTPHPELVYAIMLAFSAGLFLTCLALWLYSREGNLLLRWRKTAARDRQALVTKCGRYSCMRPIYDILGGPNHVHAAAQQTMLQHETSAINTYLEGRLLLPNYLAGALVGLGLVGTFIGLLGTLEDLGKLFGALMNTGNASMSPTEVFGDMVRRLQEPMRSMGTAFVASLYGLLGSLILGLNTLSANKIAHRLIEEINQLVREEGAYQEPVPHENHASTDHAEVLAVYRRSSDQWRALLEEAHRGNQSSLSESALLRKEVQSLAASCNHLSTAVRENIAAENEHRLSLPRTRYWQDAWVKVQSYLQRSDTEQALLALGRQTQTQTQDIKAMSQSLHRIEKWLEGNFNQQRKLTLTITPEDGRH
jgi:hypothetical protein